MNIVHSLGKRSVALIAKIAFILAIALPAHANEGEQPLSMIYKGIIYSYYSVNGFYNFSANQADKNQNELITESVNEIDNVMDSLANSSVAENENLVAAEEAWKTYRKVLRENVDEVIESGYPDLRLAGDMASTNIAFNEAMQALYNDLSAAAKPDEQTQTSRDAATTIALMMTKYSARSTSTVSQVYSGGDSEITIDALASQFEAKIKKLANLTKSNADSAQALDAAITKWDFIKNSYVNYNENRVNFIVNLYSKKIIDDIEASLTI